MIVIHLCLRPEKGEVVLHPGYCRKAWPRIFYEHTLYSLWPPNEDWSSSSFIYPLSDEEFRLFDKVTSMFGVLYYTKYDI